LFDHLGAERPADDAKAPLARLSAREREIAQRAPKCFHLAIGHGGARRNLLVSGRYRHSPESIMTVCPIAIFSGCKKCPVFRICPLKTTLGDYRPEEDQATPSNAPAAKPAKRARRRKK
jgi:hypothetical protein